jgi:hypothetical protein
MNRKNKFSNNQILGFGVLILSAVVLVKLYGTAKKLDATATEWSEIGNTINEDGLRGIWK